MHRDVTEAVPDHLPSSDQLLTETTAEGHTTTLIYDSKGNLTEEIDGEGNPTTRTSTSTVVRVGGEAKIGHFTLSFIDLSIPMAGVPIAVTRTYDSRVKTQGDFGVGWDSAFSIGSYVNNPRPGDGWQILPGQFNIPCQQIAETASHRTVVKLSEVELYVFTPILSDIGVTLGGCTASVEYQLLEGTFLGATLQVIGDNEVIYVNGTDFVVDIDFNLFDPERVRLTTVDGRVFDFDKDRGITRILDINGNSIFIGTKGITHSSGKGIVFTRDSAGRITRITDPANQALQYIYDDAGDLVEFVDRGGHRSVVCA